MIELGWLELGILMWGAFALGKVYANWYTRNNMKELLDDLGVPYDEQLGLQQKATDHIMGPRVIELTKSGDQLFAHDAKTGEFMGQDEDKEELFKYIAKRFGEGKYEVVDKTAD